MGRGAVPRAASTTSPGGRPDAIGSETTFGRSGARFTAMYVLQGGLLGLHGVPRGLSAMWCAGYASDVDRERLKGAQMGVCEGGPDRQFRVFEAVSRSCSGLCGSLECAGRAYASRTAGWCKKTDLNPLFPTLRTQRAPKKSESPM
jgi:hypothetical protein